MERILNKLDKMQENIEGLQSDMSEVKVTMARNTMSLEYHIERTDQNEEIIELLRKEIQLREQQILDQIRPIKTHVDRVKWSLRIIGGIFGAAVILKELGFFSWFSIIIN